jgi:hypothetical protein
MLDLANISANTPIDELEVAMLDNFDKVDCALTHRFTDGLYVRELFIPKDTLVTSKIHKTQHQYFLLKGKLLVWIDGVEQLIEAPYIGVTEPNTQRVVLALEDCVWATSHPNPNNETVEQIEDRILVKHENLLLKGNIKETLNIEQ